MLSSFKSKAAEQDRSTAANADELIGRTVQPSHTVVEQAASGPEPTATKKSGRDSCIGAGMSIVGKIECNGPAQVFGESKASYALPTSWSAMAQRSMVA